MFILYFFPSRVEILPRFRDATLPSVKCPSPHSQSILLIFSLSHLLALTSLYPTSLPSLLFILHPHLHFSLSYILAFTTLYPTSSVLTFTSLYPTSSPSLLSILPPRLHSSTPLFLSIPPFSSKIKIFCSLLSSFCTLFYPPILT